MSTGASENRRARLVEYAPWIVRDYMMNQGPSTAIVVMLIGVMTVGSALALAGDRAQLGQVPELLANRMLQALMEPLVFLGSFFATNGIVANDRKLAYYRFLFAKPVSPPLYYAITFVLYGIGLLVVSLALSGLWALTVRPTFSIRLFLVIALMYVAYGGIGFLLSAAWRFDWLSLVAVLFVATVGWRIWGDAEGIRHWLLYLLPPVHRDDELYALVVNDATRRIPWGSIAWLGGYGLACFFLGMLVVRKRPLGTS
ncbi:MAG: hypothetical protein WD825_00735 [Gemmatimonadaceae bacterium]